MKSWMKFGMLLVAASSCVLSYLFHLLSTDLNAILWLDGVIDSYSNESDFNQHKNTFLKGNYAPVSDEHNNLQLIPLTGHVPSDISGLYLRVGPNPISKHIGSKKYHRFDGHGMIHSVRIHNQENTSGGNMITYSNQYIQTPRYLIENKYDQNILFNEGEMKGIVGIFKKLVLLPLKLKIFGLTEMTAGSANMNIIVLGNRIYACQEGSLPYAIHWNDDNTFDSIGYELTQSNLSLPMSSHPKVDIKSQTLYFTGFSSGVPAGSNKPAAIYGSAYGSHSLQIIDHTEVMLPTRPWIHDMMITENYLLLFSGAIVTSTAGIPNGNFLTFDSNVKFEIGVASKDDADFIVGGEIPIKRNEAGDVTSKSLQWFQGLDSASVMHVANAWEETNELNHTVLIIWAPICTDFDGTFLKKKSNNFFMSRVVLNLRTGQMRKGTLGTEYNIDYPIVHPAYQGYRSKYIFASLMDMSVSSSSSEHEGKEPIGIIKYNIFEKIIVQTIYFDGGVFSGEMVPLPKERKNQYSTSVNPSSDGSDALYLVSFFYNTNTNTSEWHIYDGESMSSIPVATFALPVRVPYGFHGEWIKDEVLQGIMNDF